MLNKILLVKTNIKTNICLRIIYINRSITSGTISEILDIASGVISKKDGVISKFAPGAISKISDTAPGLYHWILVLPRGIYARFYGN